MHTPYLLLWVWDEARSYPCTAFFAMHRCHAAGAGCARTGRLMVAPTSVPCLRQRGRWRRRWPTSMPRTWCMVTSQVSRSLHLCHHTPLKLFCHSVLVQWGRHQQPQSSPKLPTHCPLHPLSASGTNVLLDSWHNTARGFTALVSDFGMARLVGSSGTIVSEGGGALGSGCGTLSHMAPEVLADGLLTKAADVFSFGVLLWEMYTGLRAWRGRPAAQIIHLVTSGKGRLSLPEEAPAALRVGGVGANMQPSVQYALHFCVGILPPNCGCCPDLIALHPLLLRRRLWTPACNLVTWSDPHLHMWCSCWLPSYVHRKVACLRLMLCLLLDSPAVTLVPLPF
jgi:hypothetical protein